MQGGIGQATEGPAGLKPQITGPGLSCMAIQSRHAMSGEGPVQIHPCPGLPMRGPWSAEQPEGTAGHWTRERYPPGWRVGEKVWGQAGPGGGLVMHRWCPNLPDALPIKDRPIQDIARDVVQIDDRQRNVHAGRKIRCSVISQRI